MKAIAAIAENRAIGLNCGLPWASIKEDFKHFREITMGQNLIVGWKTFRTLPVLKDRTIYVVDFGCGNIQMQPVKNDVGMIGYIHKIQPEHLHLSGRHYIDGYFKNLICAGGAKTYELFLPYITELYVTHIKGVYENADTFMPPFEHLFTKQELVKEFDGHRVIKYSK